ncbi:MAG: glucosaminidase domain-containing protein [Microthrixaceae bacterium]
MRHDTYTHVRAPARTRRNLGTLTLVVACLFVLGCIPEPATPAFTPADPPPPPVNPRPTNAEVLNNPAWRFLGPIMGPSRLSAAQLAAWVRDEGPGGYLATEPVEQIARYYIAEGAHEGVAGDVAFIQAVLETGWFRFSERMPPEHNNFSGIGAVDSGTSSAAFPTAQFGVRAQIQHLRAYADKAVRCDNFNHVTVTPRCALVKPKGKAPYWAQLGNGYWATSPEYAPSLLRLYLQASGHAGVK